MKQAGVYSGSEKKQIALVFGDNLEVELSQFFFKLLFWVDDAIKMFATLVSTFEGMKNPSPRESQDGVGGLMGKHGAESIHAKFNSLA